MQCLLKGKLSGIQGLEAQDGESFCISGGEEGERKQMGCDCCDRRGGISRIQGPEAQVGERDGGGWEEHGPRSCRRTLWHEATALEERHDSKTPSGIHSIRLIHSSTHQSSYIFFPVQKTLVTEKSNRINTQILLLLIKTHNQREITISR